MNINKDSQSTPPGYWFGVIEHNLRARMRAELAELGLRRSTWQILRTLADGPATAAPPSGAEPSDTEPSDTRGSRAKRTTKRSSSGCATTTTRSTPVRSITATSTVATPTAPMATAHRTPSTAIGPRGGPTRSSTRSSSGAGSRHDPANRTGSRP